MPGKEYKNQWATQNKLLCYGCTRANQGEPVYHLLHHFAYFEPGTRSRKFESNAERAGYDRHCHKQRKLMRASHLKYKRNVSEYEKERRRERAREYGKERTSFINHARKLISDICSSHPMSSFYHRAADLRDMHPKFFP